MHRGTQFLTGSGFSKKQSLPDGELDEWEEFDFFSWWMGGRIFLELNKPLSFAKREKIEYSSMPPGLAAGLTPEQLADLLAYLQSLKSN